MTVPATRSLAAVLRRQLSGTDTVRLLVATGAAGAVGNAYVNVDIEGTVVKVPRLRQATAPAVGAPAYLLAGRDFLLYIGTVSNA